MATPEEKAEIARQFILASPCHELQHVVRDVRILVADDELIDSLIPEVVRKYNMDNLVTVDSPYGSRIILSKDNCKDPEDDTCHIFLDPIADKYFTVTNHLKLVAEECDHPVETPSTTFQKKLQIRLDSYIEAHYRSGAGNVFAIGENEYVVCINSEKSNRGASWSGRWQSRTAVSCTVSEGVVASATLDGLIRNAVHYYEAGNVQMDTTKKIQKTVSHAKEDDVARLALLFIDDAEREFHMKLEEMCQHLSDQSLKTLRRRLPISKEPFNFSTGAHNLALEIAGGMK